MAELIVSAQAHQILFRDNTSVGLHRVFRCGAPLTLMRALPYAGGFLVFDLGDVNRSLTEDLPGAPARDVSGIVFYTLRCQFASADALKACVLSKRTQVITTLAQEAIAA